MIQLSQLIGQRAVSLRTAETTGTVKGIGLAGNRVGSVELSDMTIPASAVRSFEGDVLTYDDHGDSNMGPPAVDPRGMRVLDMHGDQLGMIEDLTLTADGVVETIVLVDGQVLPGSRLRAVGSYAAILSIDLPPPTGPPVKAG